MWPVSTCAESLSVRGSFGILDLARNILASGRQTMIRSTQLQLRLVQALGPLGYPPPHQTRGTSRSRQGGFQEKRWPIIDDHARVISWPVEARVPITKGGSGRKSFKAAFSSANCRPACFVSDLLQPYLKSPTPTIGNSCVRMD